jgi:riboflavin kinase/FMN adenylyltransferase
VNGSVLTIGNFDGVHAGHRLLLRRVIELGHEHRLKPAVLTFDPHPTRVVAPHRAPRLLTSIEERIALIREQGVDEVVVLPFTAEVAHLSPLEFVERIVLDRASGSRRRLWRRCAAGGDWCHRAKSGG